MQGVAGPGGSETGLSMTLVEREVISKAQVGRVFNVISGNKLSTVGIPASLRSHLLPGGQEALKSVRDWGIKALRFYLPPDELNNWQFCFQSEEKPLTEQTIEVSNANDLESFVYVPGSRAVSDVQLITVPSMSNVVTGKRLVLTNRSGTTIGLMSPKREKCLKQDVWLRENESVLLEADKCEGKGFWKVAGKTDSLKASLDTNPLLRESGPVFYYEDKCNQLQALNHENDGEPHLTLSVIRELLTNKLSKIPFVCSSSEEDINRFVESLIVKDTEEEVNKDGCFVYEDPNSNHSISVGLSIRGNTVFCYLHDPLGVDSNVAKAIRKVISGQVNTVCKDKKVCFLCPEEKFQKDYNSCGLYAISLAKMMEADHELVVNLFQDSGACK